MCHSDFYVRMYLHDEIKSFFYWTLYSQKTNLILKNTSKIIQINKMKSYHGSGYQIQKVSVWLSYSGIFRLIFLSKISSTDFTTSHKISTNFDSFENIQLSILFWVLSMVMLIAPQPGNPSSIISRITSWINMRWWFIFTVWNFRTERLHMIYVYWKILVW